MDAGRQHRIYVWIVLAGLAIYGAVGATNTLSAAPPTPQPDTTFDVLDALPKAMAVVGRGKAAAPCQWLPNPGRFRCGKAAWAFVGPYAGRGSGEGMRCLWVHPQADNKPTVLRWDRVPVGAKAHAKIALLTGSGGGKAVSLRVNLNDELLLSTSVNDEWRPGEDSADIKPGPRTASLTVEFAASNNRWRMACAQVWMTGKRQVTSRRGARGKTRGGSATERKMKRAPEAARGR
ncbi:MAG: hypothetical protein KC502_00370 [Myxococcales bacterium]|nr:hypothetical protein [Myxococcales bacterium]